MTIGRHLFDVSAVLIALVLIGKGCGYKGSSNMPPPTPPPEPPPVVISPPRLPPPPETTPEIAVTARQFLVGSDSVTGGYGLYSYLLFGRRPEDDRSAAVFQATLASMMRRFESADALTESYKRDELNVTHIPVTRAPPPLEAMGLGGHGVHAESELATWCRRHYNHTRATVLLGLVDKGLHEGPYIISVRRPLEARLPPGEHYLILNLNGATAEEADAWVRHFSDQVLEPRYWDDRSFEKLALEFRKVLSLAGVGIPRITSALAFITVPTAAASDSTD